MQPKPKADSSKLLFPSFRFCIVSPYKSNWSRLRCCPCTLLFALSSRWNSLPSVESANEGVSVLISEKVGSFIQFEDRVIIVNRPNSTEQERTLDLFFSKSLTSYAAGKAWLERIAARKLDREPEAKPQVGAAQLVALAKWGATPATDRYGDLKKIKQRTLVVNGKDDIMVPTINSYI